MRNDYLDYLEHHGVTGQKWGVRNGPPYPLDSNVSSAVEYGSASAALVVALLDVAIYATPLVASLAIRKAQKFAAERADNKISVVLNKTDDANDLPKIEGKHSIEDDAAAVNAGVKEMTSGRCENCVLCSVAYDMRRRGYDVMSGMRERGMTVNDASKMYKDYVPSKQEFGNPKAKTFKDIDSSIKKNVNGDGRGLLFVHNEWSGHCIAWEKTGSKITYIDGQRENKDARIVSIKDYDKYFIPDYSCVVRTDNLEPDVKVMTENKYIKGTKEK